MNPNGYYVAYTDRLADSRTFADLARDARTSALYRHSMFGDHNTRGAMCPNCTEPLTLLLGLDTTDERVAQYSPLGKIVHLYFCFACSIVEDDFQYQIGEDASITIRTFKAGNRPVDGPWEGYRRAYARTAVALLEYAPHVKAALKAYREGTLLLSRYVDDETEFKSRVAQGAYTYSRFVAEVPEFVNLVNQVGGEPYLAQLGFDYEMHCVECGSPMPFMATIGGDTHGAAPLFGGDFAQVIYHYCLACRIIGAVTSTD